MKPPSPITCHCLNLRRAARHVTQLYDRHLAGFGLRATQYTLLAVLDRHGPLAIHELAVELVMDRTATGRALRPLQRDGLVAIDPGRDARTRALSLTDLGRRRLAESRPLWDAAQAEFEATYGTPESNGLRQALDRVVRPAA